MVNLAVLAGGTAVSAIERKPANFTVKRGRALFLLAHDCLIPLALKVAYQKITSRIASSSESGALLRGATG